MRMARDGRLTRVSYSNTGRDGKDVRAVGAAMDGAGRANQGAESMQTEIDATREAWIGRLAGSLLVRRDQAADSGCRTNRLQEVVRQNASGERRAATGGISPSLLVSTMTRADLFERLQRMDG